jgi:4-hydroxy-L-threonine phosphate dehydrogenase PdxA
LFCNFALEYVIRKFQANLEAFKLNATCQVSVCADENLLGRNIHTIKENTEALLVSGQELDLEVSAERTKYMFMPFEQNSVQSHSIMTGKILWKCGKGQILYLRTALTNQNCIREEVRAD